MEAGFLAERDSRQLMSRILLQAPRSLPPDALPPQDRGAAIPRGCHVVGCALVGSYDRRAPLGHAVDGHWLAVRVQRLDDASALNPAFGDPTRVHFTQGGYMAEPEGRATAEFHGNRAPVPLAMPWHMKEAMPPRGLREGVWMANVTIDRMKDHCRYAGQRDVWRLPRRLRMERGFPLETEGDRDPTGAGNVQRVMRSGSIGVGLKVEMTRAAITIPEDLEALRIGICNSVEWHAFEQGRKDAPHGRPRFAYAAPSDKGRYLLGVLGRFETLPEAFGFLMHGYWREVSELRWPPRGEGPGAPE